MTGNSGVIVVVPFPPISLRDDVGTTTAFVIGLLWEDNANNGGKPVLDYIVSQYDLESDLWIDVAHGVATNGPSATQEWQTSYPVNYGSFYKFKVRARNTVGISDYSDEVEILCAQVPDKPLAPTLVRNYD